MSYRYRSPFKGEVVALFTNRGFTEILADKQVDAQIGYTFQDSAGFNGLGVAAAGQQRDRTRPIGRGSARPGWPDDGERRDVHRNV